ncbi:NYN domain-containing protein [Dyadobacter pollutisoli]|uniref:NYN domain-containing protein n=1 Tax=Dyadobacter pollutisoli TaxID=2910158 RepID=A0A9E8SNX2_9BACT|nr:NYN domain-containing protein [Dyadobacter pollutisoli]WAC11237.1 NYN domain-containing protein [Dyadobacter pollutisoli]
MEDKLVRIGVFYDGNYFLQVSNYYAYGHPRKRRLSISGLHDFIRHQVAQEEATDTRLCHIVDSHYFRGRLSAVEASQRADTLYNDRVFDDILMSEGVTTHYLPLKTSFEGYKQEKGIDVWLALEAYELSFYKRFNVLVLIAADGDYVPLVRKLNTLGIRVMLLGWDFEYASDTGQRFTTRTSQDLLEEATFPIQMSAIIDDRVKRNDPIVNSLFVQTESKKAKDDVAKVPDQNVSEIIALKNGFGFIKNPPNNLFFHHSSVVNADFNDLKVGDRVRFAIEKNQNGEDIAKNVYVM